MRSRLIAAVTALIAAVGVIVWGIAGHAAGRQHDVGNLAAASTGKHHPASASSASAPSLQPSPSPSPTPPAIVAGMRLVFHQDFTGPLASSVWDTCYPWSAVPAGCTNFNNGETEWYLPSQVQVSDGALRLIAQPDATEGTTKSGQPQQYACRSGMVTSYPGLKFEYGYVSIVAQVPTATGLWSGLWLAAANYQWPPEIDILERWGPPITRVGVYYHPVGASADITHLTPALAAATASGWHTYSVLWKPQELIFYVDGVPQMTITTGIPHQMMYLIANLANFTTSGGCTGELAIRSVDVWQ